MGKWQCWPQAKELLGTETKEFSALLDLCAFGEDQCILYIDAEVADSTFDLRVTKQDLQGPRLPVCL
jgi:hypothetical protein